MVQILEGKPGLSAIMGRGLGQGLVGALKAYGEMQGQRRREAAFSEALGNLQSIYANPELSYEQKLLSTYQHLGRNPELAKVIGGQLSQIGMQREKSFSDQIRTGRDEVSSEQFAKGFEALSKGDESAFEDVVRDRNTPLPVKKSLLDLKQNRQVRKDIAGRELRNRQSFVAQSYKNAISTEQNRLKTYLPRDEKKAVNDRIEHLKKSLKQDMRRLTKDPESYSNLSLWEELEPEGMAFEGEELGPEGMGYEEEVEKPKVRFNPKNAEHVARAKKVLEMAGGDRAEANRILAEEFIK